MSWKCSNCKMTHTGCPCSTRRVASDGTQCCSKCIAAYEAELKRRKQKR